MSTCNCPTDTYVVGDKCWKCKGFRGGLEYKPNLAEKTYLPFPGLPSGRPFTKSEWEKVSPWPNVTFDLIKRFGVFYSELSGHKYAVMPVYQGEFVKGPVFYSARLLTGEGPKYLTPKGCKKHYWSSDDIYPGDTIFISEGIADGIYMSQFGKSVALLGTNYDGSLDEQFRNSIVICAFDPDMAGVVGSFKFMSQISSLVKEIHLLTLDNDPTNYTVDEMKELIKPFVSF